MKVQMNKAEEAEAREKLPVQIIAGQAYKGRPPFYAQIIDPATKITTGYRKVSPGIPFVRVAMEIKS